MADAECMGEAAGKMQRTEALQAVTNRIRAHWEGKRHQSLQDREAESLARALVLWVAKRGHVSKAGSTAHPAGRQAAGAVPKAAGETSLGAAPLACDTAGVSKRTAESSHEQCTKGTG